MLYLLLFCFVLMAGYGYLIETYRRWFKNIVPFKAVSKAPACTRFTVLIPARNEEENIKLYLPSVLQQAYPQNLFEVIVIDDHSTDATAGVVSEMQSQYSNLKLLRLKDLLPDVALNSYKKKAIEIAIKHAAGDWIVTTDADCLVNANWLQCFADFIGERNPVFVAAPVAFFNTRSFLSIFQSLDFMSLQGITAASVNQGFHSMCNGANLAYKKVVFNQVNGFTGIDKIASGDDMLLMHKIYEKNPAGVKFLLSKDAIVRTLSMPDWKSFFNQRIRWASKADTYQDKRIFWVLALVYFLNLLLLVIFVTGFFRPVFFVYWVMLLLVKTLIELRFMRLVAAFFGEETLLKWFGFMQPFHIMYTVIAGWLGKFGSYQWKGRKVK
ncbi:MAG: glycosyltransferase [Chitinophagaceae bacterium]|nr:glycosyltransferase [Chitinophagaceae bacterium]